jgi:hypothetical protein
MVVGDRAVTTDIFNDRDLVPRLVRSGLVASGAGEWFGPDPGSSTGAGYGPGGALRKTRDADVTP